jgi:hypothetical protein
MPYAVLVSALGAIVSTAFAMFGLHSWSAMKIAPVVGAILGLAVAIASLRRYGLSLDASVEEYRGAAGVRSPKAISSLCMKIAFGVATVVSIVELPAVLLGQTTALSICSEGWIVIIGYTLYRGWQIADPNSFGKLDVFQIVAGAALLLIFGAFLYEVVVVEPTQTIPELALVKMMVVLNSCAAVEAMLIAIFALNILYRVLGMRRPQRR